MGIRQKLNESKGLGIFVAVAMVLIAAALIAYTQWPVKPKVIKQVYYTDDDGKTWFLDSMYKVPTFDHNGKPAVGAAIYTDSHGKEFCGYLYRYHADTKAELDKAVADAQKEGKGPESVTALSDPGLAAKLDLKLPGAATWVMMGDADIEKIKWNVKAPDGGSFERKWPTE